MRDYAKFAGTFWTRGSGKKLRGKPEAQVLATYLMTSPHANMIGLYYLPLVSIVHETGLSERVVRAALAVLASDEIGIAFYDEDAELVWLPMMASYQIAPELKPGDKRRGGPMVAEASKVGAHPFARAFWDRYGVPFDLGTYPFKGPSKPHQSPIEAPCKGDEAQSGRAGEEQEQAQDQEQAQAQPAVFGSKPDEIVFKYYAQHRAFMTGSRTEAKSTKERLKLIRDRLKEGFTVEDLKRAVDGLFMTPFNLGENEKRAKYIEPEHAFGKASRVERHRATADEHTPPVPAPDPPRDIVTDPAELARIRQQINQNLEGVRRQQAPFLFDEEPKKPEATP